MAPLFLDCMGALLHVIDDARFILVIRTAMSRIITLRVIFPHTSRPQSPNLDETSTYKLNSIKTLASQWHPFLICQCPAGLSLIGK
jgi:hypothetical protein